MDGGVSTDFKSLNRIELSLFIQFTETWGPAMVGWVGACRWGWVGANPMYMHMHARIHIPVEHDKHGCLHGCSHLQFSHMLILAFCSCACVHMSGNPTPPDAPTPICPSFIAAGSPIMKSQ